MSPNITLPSPGMHFGDAASAVLEHLQDLIPMDCWAVTRCDGQRQLLLHVRGNSSEIAAGDSLPWQEDCAARVCFPMHGTDGAVLASLCGFGSASQRAHSVEHASLFALLARLLASILESDLVITEHLRTRERAERAIESDALTGLLSRCGWDRYLDQEDDRHRRFGESSAVIVAELDRVSEINEHRGPDAADRYIVNAGKALRNTVRGVDVVARTGAAEFGVVVTGISSNECELLVDRIQDAFRSASVSGSVGWAPYTVAGGFAGAVAAAATAVVEDKTQRRSRAGRLVLVR